MERSFDHNCCAFSLIIFVCVVHICVVSDCHLYRLFVRLKSLYRSALLGGARSRVHYIRREFLAFQLEVHRDQ